MRLGDIVRRVTDTARSFGAAAALHHVQQRAINRVVDFRILVVVAAVRASIDPALTDPGTFRAGFARRDEILAAALPEYDMRPEFVRAALARGDECFALHDGDRLASYGWYSRTPTRVDRGRLQVRVDPSWIYRYKGFTHPDYRGRHLHGIGLTITLQSYLERGWRGVVANVRSDNFRSRRSFARAGFRPWGRVYVVGADSRAVSWSTPGCRACGFRLETIAARTSLDVRS